MLLKFTNNFIKQEIYGHNLYLMQGCELMSQYAEFVEITRKYALLYDDREEAMNAAIDYCIAHGILEDILRKHRSQILGALLEEFDEKKYAKTLREEGREEGIAETEQKLISNLMENMNITEEEAKERLGIS